MKTGPFITRFSTCWLEGSAAGGELAHPTCPSVQKAQKPLVDLGVPEGVAGAPIIPSTWGPGPGPGPAQRRTWQM